MKCQKCGGIDVTVTEARGALVVAQCDGCGEEITWFESPAATTLEEFKAWRPTAVGIKLRLS